MTNLSRLTLAAALLGGMASPVFAQTAAIPSAAVPSAAPTMHAKLHSRVHAVAATETAPSKVAPAKDAVADLPKDASKGTMKDMSKDAPTAAGSTAMTASPSGATAVKPVAPSQTVQAPTSAKLN